MDENKKDISSTEKEERAKVEREKALKLKAQREADVFKRRYFEYYDDIKISHREDW